MSEKEKETGEIEERDGFIAIPDGSLYYKKYDIQGKVGLPVVLLHGNRGTHRDFSSYIEVLTKAGCSVIAMDSRGHGASVMKMAALKAAVLKTGRSQEKGKRRWTGAADMAEDVVRLLDHLKIEKAVILGFSDGANTALEFAADHPERAEKIIAVSANALPDGLIPPMLFMENTPVSSVRKILENIKPVGKFGKNGVKREQFLSSLILIPLFSQKRDWKKISVPVLLMAGTHDLIKESHTRIIARCIPGSRLVLIKGGTHQGFF